LRKTRAAYAGKCIKVRRDSDNTTQDIGFDTLGNLDTANLLTFVGAANGFIDTWYDQVGSANLTSPGGTAWQPRIVNAGALEVTKSGTVAAFFGIGNFTNSAQVCLDNASAPVFTFGEAYVVAANNYAGPGITDNTDYAAESIFQCLPTSSFSARIGVDHLVQTLGNPSFPDDNGDPQSVNNSSVAFSCAVTAYGGVNSQYWWQGFGADNTTATGLALGMYPANGPDPGGRATESWNGWIMEALVFNGSNLLTNYDKELLWLNQKSYYSINTSTLMDAVGYQCGFGYSTRKLRAGYQGPCMTVRRDSDNTTQDIGFDAATGDLDTTALLAFVGVGNGYVVTWYDQSPYATHQTQATNADQPQIVSSGSVITQNGRPILFFNNTTASGTIGLASTAGAARGSGGTNWMSIIEKTSYTGTFPTGGTQVCPVSYFVSSWGVTFNGWSGLYVFQNQLGPTGFVNINNTGIYTPQNSLGQTTGNLEQAVIDNGVGVGGGTSRIAIGCQPGGINLASWYGYIGEVIGINANGMPNNRPAHADQLLIYQNQKTWWGTP
jgi:hypothetical protein